MKAIIVAGGKGERLRPLTNEIPKPMVEVNGKPILLHIINLFKKNGVKDFIIALCYLPEVIVSYFGDGSKFGVNITYTFEDSENPLGTAGAISLAEDIIDDTFIVTYADILRDLDIKKMINFHKENNALATLNIYSRKSKNAKSMIILDENKREYPDPKHSEREVRKVVAGRTRKGRLLFIVYTTRNNLIRIISARDLNKRREGDLYEKAA